MKHKFSEYLELLLQILYKEDSKEPGTYFDLNEISAGLNVNDVHLVWEGASILESRGLIRVIKALGGGCHVSLTGQGRLLVENGGQTGIIKKYEENPSKYYNVTITGDKNVVSVGTSNVTTINAPDIKEERKILFKLIEELKTIIKEDKSLSSDIKEEKLLDTQGLEIQISKREPNMNIVASIIESLSNILSISNVLGQLMELLKLK